MQSQVEERWAKLRQEWRQGVFDPAVRVCILVAHPDDETIGASALLAHCTEPLVIFMTDGAPKETRLWPPEFRGSREDYANSRRQEASTALADAGIDEPQIEWLGGMDQEAIFHVAKLADKLAGIMREREPHLLITHPYEGGHPDHDAAALTASIAMSGLSRPPLHLEMTSYHAHDGRCETGCFLDGNPENEFLFAFSQQDVDRKRAMLNAYASQKLVLENFSVDSERLRPAPAYNFTSPAHDGKLWYEILGWQMTGERWRSLACEALYATSVSDALNRA